MRLNRQGWWNVLVICLSSIRRDFPKVSLTTTGLASHAGVFRGARISSLLWGGKKYELPLKRLRGRLQPDIPLAKKSRLNFTMEPRRMVKCSRDLPKPFESQTSLSEKALIIYVVLYLPRHYTQWCPSSRAAWLFLCQRATYVWRTWIVCWR